MRLELNGIFKDDMVFQWGTGIRIFGSSSEDCDVLVSMYKDDDLVSGITVHTNDKLKFMAELPAVDSPGGPFEFRISSSAGGGKEPVLEKTITGCYAGEV